MRSISADGYRASTLKLAARIQTREADLGTIWMRIDGVSGAVLRFDNMMERPGAGAITGTTGWTERSIVLEVPETAASVHYGFFLKGSGQVRARGFRLDVVDIAMPTTEQQPYRRTAPLLSGPINLDFLQKSRS